MENYFNYFTEVEDYFQQKRGTWMLLSTLDWALIDTWREAGIPLEIVFRGMDATFEKWEKRRTKTRRINGLAYCLQEVSAAFEEQQEAHVGAGERSTKPAMQQELFSKAELASFFENTESALAAAIDSFQKNGESSASGDRKEIDGIAARVQDPLELAKDFERITRSLQEIAHEVATTAEGSPLDFEQLERRLSVGEEKLLAAITRSLPEPTLVELESESDRALGPYRRNMRAEMIANLKKQFIRKRLLELWSLPRISLFHLQ